ncbi:aminodeoxychorismate lyase [Paenibacillus sp. LMG 31456]|uniref:Aminodeoxychorismate lyase n=1 Tax=Paenibacillus foliorum TaxID=2654974 RepID=A0A972GXW1_9BACL|nr:aminodeoxychorismate lyase [Paenibacillus foliorum]NOU98293.1 aminodeoxychorismate lyase [Paenibacillus foliorum]
MKIYVNGVLIDEGKAVVSVYDHGFLYGIGLFETFRTYGGIAFLLQEHVDRLKAGCEQLGISYSPSAEQWQLIVKKLLQANELEDAYIRFTVTAGRDLLGLPGGDYAEPSVIVYIKELPARNEQLYQSGKPLQLLKLIRNTPEGAVRLKSLHYMNNILAKRELMQYPWALNAEGLFADGKGNLAEGIVSNLFFFKNEQLFTPSIGTGILPGITRAFLMRVASEAGMKLEEGLYTWSHLLEADEVYITNSIQEIVPITSLFDTKGQKVIVGNGNAGELTKELIRLYERHTLLLAQGE